MESSTSGNAFAGSAMTTVASQAVRYDRLGYQILHWGFTVLPILAGADKFLSVLTNWQHYLAAPFAVFGPHTTMSVVGVVEIIAGLGVAWRPRLFAPVVTLWLWGIIANLLVLGSYYDVALRDFGLSLGALALWGLSQHFDVTERTT